LLYLSKKRKEKKKIATKSHVQPSIDKKKMQKYFLFF